MRDRDLTVLVPSRGRPEAVAELTRAFGGTSNCTTASGLTFVVDEDEPLRSAYEAEVSRLPDGWLSLVTVPGGTMVKALNEAAAVLLERPVPPWALAFLGDDHRPRTRGWDQTYLHELARIADRPGPGRGVAMVYGDDTIQGASLPTQIAMTSETVRRLGWMAPPTLKHLYVDNAWLALGRGVDRIEYVPDVVVEHLHPGAGKVPWTEGHARVNAPDVWEHDSAAFATWETSTDRDGRAAAVLRLRGEA